MEEKNVREIGEYRSSSVYTAVCMCICKSFSIQFQHQEKYDFTRLLLYLSVDMVYVESSQHLFTPPHARRRYTLESSSNSINIE